MELRLKALVIETEHQESSRASFAQAFKVVSPWAAIRTRYRKRLAAGYHTLAVFFGYHITQQLPYTTDVSNRSNARIAPQHKAKP